MVTSEETDALEGFVTFEIEVLQSPTVVVYVFDEEQLSEFPAVVAIWHGMMFLTVIVLVVHCPLDAGDDVAEGLMVLGVAGLLTTFVEALAIGNVWLDELEDELARAGMVDRPVDAAGWLGDIETDVDVALDITTTELLDK